MSCIPANSTNLENGLTEPASENTFNTKSCWDGRFKQWGHLLMQKMTHGECTRLFLPIYKGSVDISNITSDPLSVRACSSAHLKGNNMNNQPEKT